MTKYKNKDGIELNYTGNDVQSTLTREVVEKACKILGEYNRSDLRSAEWSLHRGINFLLENFDIEDDERSDEWRIEQFNRNRAVEDQVHSIQEMSDAVEDMGKE
tara:strand:- start:37 stop:348 length:312 start_codon:yes stop_codon:yes gene_type:complete